MTGYSPSIARRLHGQINRDMLVIENRVAMLGRRITDHSVAGGPGSFAVRQLDEVRALSRELHRIVDSRTEPS